MSELSPTPADNYEDLLKQFKSVVLLANACTKGASLARLEIEKLIKQLAELGTLGSQRAANEALTNELEKAENEIQELKAERSTLYDALSKLKD
jgi:aspartate/methionine/tyrosine aminotransferase